MMVATLRFWNAPIQHLIRSPIFWIGLTARLILMPFFGSTYIRELFIPFVDQFILNPSQNPWNHFPSHYFPYGIVLLALLALPKGIGYALFGQTALGYTPLSLALMKLPLLGMDFLMLLVLVRVAGRQWRALLPLYWLSPIVLFVNYIHGQLDIVSMTFCLSSILLLQKNRIILSAVLFALAALCKFHVFLICPFLMAFLWNSHFSKVAIRLIGSWLSIVLGLTCVGLFPLLQNVRYVTVGSPEAMRIFAGALNIGTEQPLYLGLSLVLLLLGRLCLSTSISHIGLWFGSASLFGTLLVTTHAMPGWYLWVLPFLSLLCAIYHSAPKTLYWAFNLSHVLYSLLFYQWAITTPPLFRGILFTVLQTTLAGSIIAMWWIIARKEVAIDRRLAPLFIGVAGNSGSGKDYFSQTIQSLFSVRNVTMIAGDDYHRWERNSREWQGITHLNPLANDLTQLENHAEELSNGRSVEHHHYDHLEGVFARSREIKPTPVIVVQGLHALYLRNLRDVLNLKIFLATDESIATVRKIKRDAIERTQHIEQVLEKISQRSSDAKTHIFPQQHFADWIIETSPESPITRTDMIQGVLPSIRTSHIVWNDSSILHLIAVLRAIGITVSCEFITNNVERLRLILQSELPQQITRQVAMIAFPNLRQRIRSRTEPQWLSGQEGFEQLIALALIGRQPQEKAHGMDKAQIELSTVAA